MNDSVKPSLGPKVPLPTIFAFGTLGLPTAALVLIFQLYLPRHYVSLGLSFVAVGLAMTIVRIIDVFFDPLVAVVMDRTKTPIGRYRPWIILGTPIVLLGVWRLSMPTGSVSEAYLVLWLVVTYAGLSMVTLGTAAWSAVLAKSYNDRSRLYGWTQMMALIGAASILLLPIISHNAIVAGVTSSMPKLGLILVVAFPVALFICTVFTPEHLGPVPKRPKFAAADYRRALTRPSMLRLVLADLFLSLGPGTAGPLLVYFFHDAKGFAIPDVGFILIAFFCAGILGNPFWARLAQRFGKHRTVQIVCVCNTVLQTTVVALPRVSQHYTLLEALPMTMGMFSVGFCSSSFVPLIRSMVADIVDEVRLEQGQDLTSLLFSMVTTTTKIGASISVTVVFPILALVHYNGTEGAINTPGAIFGLEMCYLLAPVIFIAIGGVVLFGYKLDSKRHAEICQALVDFDVAAAAESLTGPTAEPPARVPAA